MRCKIFEKIDSIKSPYGLIIIEKYLIIRMVSTLYVYIEVDKLHKFVCRTTVDNVDLFLELIHINSVNRLVFISLSDAMLHLSFNF